MNDVPLHEDPNRAQMLEALDLNEAFPVKLYRAVAEVLTFLYRSNNKQTIS